MAEFGELLPGTEWRDRDGMRQRISDCHVVAVNRGGRVLVHSERCKEWVPWVEPIAVGDRVIVDCWADHDVHHKACATFTDDGEDWVTIRLGFSSGPNFKTLRADECRKVNDE